jgi:hypothetical protein
MGPSMRPRVAVFKGSSGGRAPSGSLENSGSSTSLAVLDREEASERSGAESAARGRQGRANRIRPREKRHRLLLVSTAVLALGMLGVLFLNALISAGAFRRYDLEIDLIYLAEEEEALSSAVQQAESPVEVERRARALGMVPAKAPVFLRLADGALLGEPVPAPAATAPVDLSDAPGIQPSPSPSDTPSQPGTADEAATEPLPTPSGSSSEPAGASIPSPQPTPTAEAELR